MESSEFLGFLKSRSSVRSYTGDQLSPDEIRYLFTAASTAPSAGNREAWDVIVCRQDDLLEALADAAYGQEFIREAGAVCVVCANYVRSMSRYGERGILYAVQDATIAGTYMMLAAHALRRATCWVGAFEEDEVRELLGIPTHVRPVAILAIGEAAEHASSPERMPAHEHLHEDYW
ncbi:MAG: nitroreductase [Methanocalculus sp. MSAO_Arc1]|uniref:nitroreductase family protein n=1 Tax=Methanocalculus TaxID=71151 RepID=UPI000FF144F2|nr:MULTISPECIES: nitroreductase family protein [unclassified Methanocalculus]MCP1663193.1 nitroreductase [Methanocalculus sp. AMF5]RQD79723.1 MAG: nitroreductase [Methanocalculus sp. MSAO_Arc1]